MKLGEVEKHLHIMRRIGLPILLTLFLLAKRGVTAVRNPPEELWVSSPVLMVCCCIFVALRAAAASVAHYGKETHEMVRPHTPLPAFGLAAPSVWIMPSAASRPSAEPAACPSA